MLYLMTVLTFLAGILFYILSPTDDHLEQAKHQAEPMIQDFLTQHQAAKDYFRMWYGANLGGAAGSYFNIPHVFINSAWGWVRKYEAGLPVYSGIVDAMCTNNAGTPGADYPPLGEECFISRVICTNNAGGELNCNQPDAEKNSYIVTYGGWGVDSSGRPDRPGWWPSKSQRARRYEKWRRAMTDRTHGSLTCGTLFEHPTEADPTIKEWCIDNGQTPLKGGACAKVVPAGIIAGLNAPSNDYLDDMLICMSYLKNGPNTYYPYGLRGFWDGLDNQAQHASPTAATTRKTSGNVDSTHPWKGISGQEANIEGTAVVAYSNLPAVEFKDSTATLHFDTIHPSSNQDFTITTLAGLQPGSQLDLIRFGADYNQTSNGLHIYYGGDESPKKLHFVIRADGKVHTFEKDMNLTLDAPISATLVREGKKLSLYVGDKRVFKSAEVSDVTNGLINDIVNNSMSIKKYDGNVSSFVYGVRYYDRALSSGEVGEMFHEDARRYSLVVPEDVTNTTGETSISLE